VVVVGLRRQRRRGWTVALILVALHCGHVMQPQCGKEYDLTLWSSLIAASGKSILIENCHWGLTGEAWSGRLHHPLHLRLTARVLACVRVCERSAQRDVVPVQLLPQLHGCVMNAGIPAGTGTLFLTLPFHTPWLQTPAPRLGLCCGT